jgi:hypothetical protein
MDTNSSTNATEMTTKMSKSELIVAGLAVALLVAGFATGVFAKPVQTSPHGAWFAAHVSVAQDRQQD